MSKPQQKMLWKIATEKKMEIVVYIKSCIQLKETK